MFQLNRLQRARRLRLREHLPLLQAQLVLLDPQFGTGLHTQCALVAQSV